MDLRPSPLFGDRTRSLQLRCGLSTDHLVNYLRYLDMIFISLLVVNISTKLNGNNRGFNVTVGLSSSK
jgi:hypothetical protein